MAGPATEDRNPLFADLDLWPTARAVAAMAREQAAAAAAVEPQTGAIAAAADAAAARLADESGRLVHVGAGTSGRLAVQDGVELGPTYDWPESRWAFALAGGPEALLTSVEGAEDDEAAAESAMRDLGLGAADVVIGVAASGRTPFTVAAVRAAAAAGALTVGIAGNAGTPLLAAAAHPILIETGAEVLAGSTRMKAGTAQKIVLNLLSTAIMLRLGRIHAGLMVAMRATNRKLRVRASAMVGEISGVDGAEAQVALESAGGDIRTAVLIAKGLDAASAKAALAAASGNLRVALARLAPPANSR
jgi:N-acetylmuramic acid 6-phosphate etherase